MALNGQGVQKISRYKFKNKKKLVIKLELDLEPGMLVIFVVEGQRSQRNRGKRRWIFVVHKRYNGGAKEFILLELKEEDTS